LKRNTRGVSVKAVAVGSLVAMLSLGSGLLVAMREKGGFDPLSPASALPELRIQEDRLELDPPDHPFAFAVLGDMRWESPPRIAILRDAQKRSPLFMANLGDAVSKGLRGEWEAYIDELTTHWDRKVPYFHIPGGHSLNLRVDGLYPALFQHFFGRTFYCVDVKAWRFIFLDTSDGTIPSEQLDWLDRRLSESVGERKRVALFIHHPPRSDAQGITHALSDTSTRELSRTLAGSNVAAIFAGHIHSTFSYTWESIPVHVTSLNGSSWKGAGKPAEYLHVQVMECEITVTRVALRPNLEATLENL
jgi:3',5'-cyclic AMP phosphodiesterase CpdA